MNFSNRLFVIQSAFEFNLAGVENVHAEAVGERIVCQKRNRYHFLFSSRNNIRLRCVSPFVSVKIPLKGAYLHVPTQVYSNFETLVNVDFYIAPLLVFRQQRTKRRNDSREIVKFINSHRRAIIESNVPSRCKGVFRTNIAILLHVRSEQTWFLFFKSFNYYVGACNRNVIISFRAQ